MADRRQRAVNDAVTIGHAAETQAAATAREIGDSLEIARKELIARLATVGAGWRRSETEALLAEIERQLTRWGAEATVAIAGAQTEVAGTALQIVTTTVRRAGIEILSQPVVTERLIRVAHLRSAIHVTDVTADTIRKIDTRIRRAALGLEPPFQVMQDLGPITGRGVFATAFDRSETIVRTEMAGTAQGAAQDALEDYAPSVPGMQKQWIAVIDGRTRPSHADADGQIVEIDEPFTVGGEELDHPADPNGSAEETINCRCVEAPFHPDW